jgi:hypothetical protein
MDLERFQMDYAKDIAPAEYATMNESQRDDWFLKESKPFWSPILFCARDWR